MPSRGSEMALPVSSYPVAIPVFLATDRLRHSLGPRVVRFYSPSCFFFAALTGEKNVWDRTLRSTRRLRRAAAAALPLFQLRA
jgi:hypothetical protein